MQNTQPSFEDNEPEQTDDENARKSGSGRRFDDCEKFIREHAAGNREPSQVKKKPLRRWHGRLVVEIPETLEEDFRTWIEKELGRNWRAECKNEYRSNKPGNVLLEYEVWYGWDLSTPGIRGANANDLQQRLVSQYGIFADRQTQKLVVPWPFAIDTIATDTGIEPVD